MQVIGMGGPTARLVSAAGPLVVSQIAANALLLLTTLLIARALGPAGFGTYAIAIAVFGLVAFASDLGLGLWGLRAIEGDPDPWSTVSRISAARALSILAGAALGVGAVVVLPLPGGVLLPALVMLIAVMPAALSLEWALLGLGRSGLVAMQRLLVGVTMLSLGPILAFTAGPAGAAAGYASAIIVGATASWVFMVHVVGRPRLRWVGHPARILTRSFPMGLSAILAQVFWQGDSLLTGTILGAGPAGEYAAPMRILSGVTGLGWALGTALLPIYAALDREDPNGVSLLATKTIRLLLLACLPVIGVCVGGASTITHGLLGAGFGDSAPVLAIGSLTVSLALCGTPVGYVILARRRDRLYAWATAVGIVGTVPLAIALAHLLGITGVAIAMLIGEACIVAMLFRGARRSGLHVGSIRLALACGVVIGTTCAIAAAYIPGGIIGIAAVAVFAEAPFAVAIRYVLRDSSRPKDSD